jgi:hypothetical protein
MKSLSCRGALVALVALGTLAGPSAQAATVTVDDVVGDVSVHTPRGTRPLGDTRANVDLVRASVTHAPRLVRVRLTYDELVRGTDFRIAGVVLRTPARERFVLHWGAFPGKPRGDVELYGLTGDDPQRRCRGLSGAPDYARDVVTVEVPRSCLGRPRWVEFVALGEAFGTGESDDMYGDIAGVDRWAPWRRWSKPVRQG